ncbi:MarR family winged helix-turn-helix transcriptional regulator [Clostridium sp. C2-6-12]|uniref:MarR family winged helix-turn-helix transcriptional regulator n=1 Tax=Clostridium sp. C2-6-12 TaxID=2698832 RepID=UPI001367A030|nr:MarR family winged helix-turn-helix transcriptional regulator [Clostridium sp. C2-6-12]
MLDRNKLLGDCLYYSVNKLSRIIGKFADEEFRITGLSPTYAFLLSVVNESDGISQKEIGEVLDVAPSTITRFIDKLENSGHLERRVEGKNSFIYSTEKGKAIQNDINTAWSNLHSIYKEYLGVEECKALTNTLNETCAKLK